MRAWLYPTFFLFFSAPVLAQQPVAPLRERGKSDLPKADTIGEILELIDPLKLPVFPGGEKELMRFVAQNTWWPKGCEEYYGVIAVQFIVDTLGECRDWKILKTPGACFEPVVATIFSKMPCWISGEMNGRKVPLQFTLPIRIRLE